MILRKLTIEAKQLKSIPEDERALFLMIQVLFTRVARRGLWADPHAVPPWEWRARRKRDW